MGRFVKGDVIVTPFPFSDLSSNKRRPALVVASLTGDDVVLCQITSRATADAYAVELSAGDFESGRLRQSSCIRPNRLFTADGKILLYSAGVVKKEKMQEVVEKIVEIVTA